MGTWGEDQAAAYLRAKGYTILERDWHSGHRDIDIIAREGKTFVFVEVKTRRDRAFADPKTAVDYQKQRNLRIAIHHYLNHRQLDGPWRFDVITVVGALGSSHPEIQHIQDFQLL